MKQRLQTITGIIILCLLLFSCNSKETTLPLVDLTSVTGNHILHLNELIKDIRLVRLETDEDILVPRFYQSIVGQKYILIIGRDAVLQFDTDGNFIRTVAKQGKGPGEFVGINTFSINDEESEFYLHDYRKSDQLSVYSLTTGKLLREFPLPKKRLSNFSIGKDHIVCICNVFSPLELFTMSYEGELLDTIPKIHPLNLRSYSSRGAYLARRDEILFYMNTVSDTLFQLDGVTLSPVFSIKVKNRYDPENNLTGNLPMISVQTDTKTLIANTMFIVEKTSDGGIMSTIGESNSYLRDNTTGEVKSVKGYYDDYFDMENNFIVWAKNGDVAYLSYSALTFKDLLNQALDNKDLDPQKVKEFRDLDNLISEDDNPVFMIGKLVN